MQANTVTLAPGAVFKVLTVRAFLCVYACLALVLLGVPATANDPTATDVLQLGAIKNVEDTRGVADDRRAVIVIAGGQVESDGARRSASVVGDTLLAAKSVLSIMRAGL